MTTKKKILIAAGGTGGHVFPAYALAKYFFKKNFLVKIVTDKRGLKFLENYNDINLTIINSETIYDKNPLILIISIFKILQAFFKSFFVLNKFKPNIIFGMGGYSSFPVCLAAKILRIPFIIYENNMYIGKTNKYLLPYTKKIFVSYSNLGGIDKKYNKKVFEVGNILREEILNYKNSYTKESKEKFKVLILGGSQAAKSFGEKLPDVFKKCSAKGIKLKIYQQCQLSQKKILEEQYDKLGIENEIFYFCNDLSKYFSKIDISITRSGSSMLAELLNCNIPFISIPLPNSAENHQFHNAKYFENKGYGLLVEEHEIGNELFSLIKLLHEDKELLIKIKTKQKQHSDKNVFEKIFIETKEFLND